MLPRPAAPDPAPLPLPLLGRLLPAGFPSPADDYLDGESVAFVEWPPAAESELERVTLRVEPTSMPLLILAIARKRRWRSSKPNGMSGQTIQRKHRPSCAYQRNKPGN